MTEAQVDLFLDQLVDAPFRDERNLMAFPFFSLEKRPRKTPFIYDDGRVSLKVEPSTQGMATIWDKDILIYVASLLLDQMERGRPVEPTVRFSAHDFLVRTKRSTSNRGYDLLLDALYRLRNTSILTNIRAGGEAEKRNFGWIAEWKVIERVGRGGVKRMAGVEVTLSRWMFDAIVKDKRVLSIDPGYFELSQGLERRIYELARKYCGRSKTWSCPLSKLAERCGSLRAARQFKAEIKAIAGRGGVLGYAVEVDEREDGAWAVIYPRVCVEADASEVLLISDGDAEQDIADALSPLSASAKAYERARKLAPGYDLENLERRWREWSRATGATIENPDAAFLAFVKRHIQENPL